MQRPGQPGVVPEVLIACGGHDEEFLDLVDLIDGDGDDVFPASSDEEDEDLHEQPPLVPEVMPVVFLVHRIVPPPCLMSEAARNCLVCFQSFIRIRGGSHSMSLRIRLCQGLAVSTVPRW